MHRHAGTHVCIHKHTCTQMYTRPHPLALHLASKEQHRPPRKANKLQEETGAKTESGWWGHPKEDRLPTAVPLMSVSPHSCVS